MPNFRACALSSVFAAAALAASAGTALAQEGACAPMTLLSPGDQRDVQFVDVDDNGLSVGDHRVGHRRLFDQDGNFVADRMWILTVIEVNDAGEPTVTSTDYTTLFADGVLYAHIEFGQPANVEDTGTLHTNAQTAQSEILGGTGVFAGASGTIEIVARDGNDLTLLYAPVCP